MKISIPFRNTYNTLPDVFFQKIEPTPVSDPQLLHFNSTLAQDLGISLLHDNGTAADADLKPAGLSQDIASTLAAVFSGNTLPDGAEPLAMAYAGHQFGHFVPQLGDGRAILLGEVTDSAGRQRDIQLKGAGRTRFSRGGDGRAALGPVIREYIVSEAMHALGIPTTRALAMVRTGEPVYRETPLPGAIVTRVANAHIRVGTFEYFAARQNTDAIKSLADYVINRLYPHCREHPHPYRALLTEIMRAQANLVAGWMQVGFIHGVMNTDNCSVAGETIDYGPCAFMDHFDAARVFSSIDHQDRYAYKNQPLIARWNLENLGACLAPLLADTTEEAVDHIKASVEVYRSEFDAHWQRGFLRKIGLETTSPGPVLPLVHELLERMQKDRADFTNTFRFLGDDDENLTRFRTQFRPDEGIDAWIQAWKSAIKLEYGPENDLKQARAAMNAVNPAYIPRNHRVEEALTAALHGDMQPTQTLLDLLADPYRERPGYEVYMEPPKPEEVVHQTFCGT